jgi:DNA-directed RNA polymerase specialized sigma24 family protein
MSPTECVTVWLARLKGGERDAAAWRLWQVYFERLVRLARARLASRPRLVADAEDVALCAFDSFVRAAAASRFPRLEDSNDLWQVLLVLTARKTGKLIRREQADRRGGGKVQVFSELPAQDESSLPQAQVADSEPDPAEAAAMAETCERLLAQLQDEELTRVAVWKLEGFSNADIAEKLNRSVGSVERKLRLKGQQSSVSAQGDRRIPAERDYGPGANIGPGQVDMVREPAYAEPHRVLSGPTPPRWRTDANRGLQRKAAEFVMAHNGPGTDELLRWLADELPASQVGAIEAHVERCPTCQAAVESLLTAAGQKRPVAQMSADCQGEEAFLKKLAMQEQPTDDVREALTPSQYAPVGQLTTSRTSEGKSGEPPSPAGFDQLTLLGSGGMGTVYRAFDTSLGRQVALKCLRRDCLSSASLARFRKEGHALARLQHPHIVQVFGWTEHAGQPILVLEHVPCGSLAQRLPHGKPLEPATAARLVAVLARAVQAAHQVGVVHRDLKPANVLMGPPLEGNAGTVLDGFPRVTDFGLARLEVSPGGEQAENQPTASGVVMGTPAYMAPEQADGRTDEVGPAVDVWALAVILYRCLTGLLPFAGDTVLETLERIKQAEPAPVRSVAPAVPQALEDICRRCLSARPTDRPSAQELAGMLEHFLATGSGPGSVGEAASFAVRPEAKLAALPASPEKRAASPTRRRLAWAAIAVVLIVAGVLTALPMRPPLPARMEAEPLALTLDVRVWKKQNTTRGLTLADDGALPLRAGDFMRVEAIASRPAYLYLIYLDAKGEASPYYPWRKYDWNDRPAEERRRQLNEPEDPQKDGSPLDPGPSGIEAVLLLGRDEPLSEEENNRLAKLLAGKPQQGKFDSLLGAVWLGGDDERFAFAGDRGRPDRDQAGQVLDPVERVRRLVRRELPALAVARRGVCYPFAGR